MAKDYYAILGVSRSSSEADIKTAFRKLAHQHHPDKKQGNSDKFKEITEAYQTLGNKEKRQRYDQFGAAYDQPGAQSAGGFRWNSQDGSNPFAGFGSSGQANSFDFGDLGDILGDMFNFGGGNHGRRSQHAQRGNDVETVVAITFDEAYRGTEKKIDLTLPQTCETCSGSGNDPSASVVTCVVCHGTGAVTSVHSTFLGNVQSQSICAQCNGAGKKSDRTCSTCKGQTTTQRNQSISVKIPAGIDDTRAIRLTGKGEGGLKGGPSGDLYIRVRVSSDPRFQRDGYDIRSKETVLLSILSNGGSVMVQTPSGPAKLKIPSHTASGTRFVMHSKGFEKLTGRGRGDQYVTVHAQVPIRLTHNQKRLLEEFENSLSLDK